MDPALPARVTIARQLHRGRVAMQIARIGLDLAKYVFEIHGVDAHGKAVLRKTLRRSGIDPSRFMVEAIPFLGYDPESYQRAPVQPTRLVSEGDVVETGDGEFQVLHLPGHSPGSIALWERSSGLLF